jgi:hypothetical protein
VHKYETPMTVSKVLCIFAGGLLIFETLGLSLSSIQVFPTMEFNLGFENNYVI